MKYQRHAKAVLEALGDLQAKQVIAKKPITIIFPVRFRDIKLAVVGENSFVYGLFAITNQDRYALFNINGYVELGKANVTIEQHDGQDYYHFSYEPGDVVIKTREVVARSNLIFIAIDEFVFKGKVPWYVSYSDMGLLFKTAREFAGTKANIFPAVMEFFASYVGRSASDRTKFIREVAKTEEDFGLDKIRWVPLRSVFWSAPGTVNKIAGAYYNDGVVSALVNPSQKVERTESILRA